MEQVQEDNKDETVEKGIWFKEDVNERDPELFFFFLSFLKIDVS